MRKANPNETDGAGFRGSARLHAVIALMTICAVGSVSLADTTDRVAHDFVDSFVERYCIDCHGGVRTKGDFDLKMMLAEVPLVRNGAAWVNALQRVVDSDMPPKDKEQPTAEERSALGKHLDRLVVRFNYASVAHPGHEPIRRMTHTEYRRTINDLLGIDWDPGRLFPPELTGRSGFENSANTLFLQGGLMDRYLGAADRAVDLALPAGANEPQRIRVMGLASVLPAGTKQAEAVVLHFLPRAYRRPPTPKETAAAMAHYRAAIGRGFDHEAAIRMMLKNILVEPAFLLRGDLNPGRDHTPGKPQLVGPHELAARLSYFLWATMPDDALRSAAAQTDPEKRLDHPDVLRAHVDRMLDDPRALSLGTIFANQWLGVTNLGSLRRPDPIDHPEFTESLMHAMRMETASTFHAMVKDDRPVREIVDARYTYVNAELARYYGWKGVKGDHMRRVPIGDKRRGGFLTQAGVLMVTAFPDRTSPVVRGNWVLSRLLGTPPPPPPPDVTSFDERIEERDLSPRRKMELHRRKKSCAACHDRIDPIGFALENFDQLGKWRSRDDGRAIDASGKLPEGTAFDGPGGLKRALIDSRLDDLNRQVTRKMLAYALGRQLEYTDEHTVLTIAQRTKDSDYGLRTLVHAIAQSRTFRFQQQPGPDEGATP